MTNTTNKPLFELGETVATPGALEVLERSKQPINEFLNRHVAGDWGDLCEEDAQANTEAIEQDLQILSSYRTTCGVKLWIITEHDRSVTTILLPEEY